ncbi:dihydrofolate reductase [Cylas formicarius]|uniref:dihydrofolate reductase n=1 Tax=Cylas formicarius TaxID=197179 RepID=UPI002958AD5A|nr:dihydrofolate reductase [Cylas formicarius]
MPVQLKLIAAACENLGIGKDGDLPWRLKKEMSYFSKMTSSTKEKHKKNIVIMGRRTWDCIPLKYKPLSNRINFVLSRSNPDLKQFTDTYAFSSLDKALEELECDRFSDKYEEVWVIGGSSIYREALESKNFYRLYLTKIFKDFDCDTFLPPIPDDLKEVSDPAVPSEIQEENGIQYTYKVYER